MATSKKNTKGNKTAHVLNLLTAPGAPKEGAPAGEETTETAAEQAAPAAPSRPLLPPILEVAQANDDSLSQQIQQALLEELEETPPAAQAAPAGEPAPVGEELPTAPPAAEPQTTIKEVPPVAAETPVSSGGKMSQEDIEKMLTGMAGGEPEPAPAPEPPAPSGGKMSQADIEKMLAGMAGGEPEPAPAPEPPVPPAPKSQPLDEEEVSYVNIMQTLVEEKAPSYIKKFGLCTCKHCEADVKALTLSNLVPKYVVLSKMDRIPMLTVYEGRFSATIFAQLTRACKVVMDHPHHGRSE